MAVITGHTHNDHVSFTNGTPSCICHHDYDSPLVYEYIDGIELPEAIELTVTEHFKEKRGMLIPQIIDIVVKLSISRCTTLTNVRISIDKTAYNIVFERVLHERYAFLIVVQRLFKQLKDQVAASEMYAINQAIAAVSSWIERGNQLVEHDRLRELIKYAIDDAYRTGSQGPVNAP